MACNLPVDIWMVPLQPGRDLLDRDTAILDAREQDRAARFHNPQDSSRFIAAHIALRKVLSKCTGVPPAEITFQFGEHGKPAITQPSPIAFNMSRSGDLAVLAVAVDQHLGVDIEQIDLNIDWRSVAETCFTKFTIKSLSASEHPVAVQRFYEEWVRMESSLKASGEGLSRLGTDELPQWTGANRYHVTHLVVAPGYCAALATEAKPNALVFHQFDWDKI